MDVLVLCYHAVSETWPADLAVTPTRLGEQVGLLLRLGYRPVTFHEAVTTPGGGKTVAVTFDDGFASVARLGLPVLAGLGVPASLFVTTDFVDGEEPLAWPGIEQWADGAYAAELDAISEAEVRRLVEAGWEIGSHTCTHPRLTTLDEPALARELEESRRRCEEVAGAPCRSLAYPYGDSDERVIGAAERAGYETACLLPSRFAPPRRLAWPRVGVYVDDGPVAFRAKISPSVRRLRAGPLWPLLTRLAPEPRPPAPEARPPSS